MVSGLAGGQQEKVCPSCISEIVRCRKLILGGDICATSFDLTFNLAVATLSYKILSGLYFGNHKVYEVDTW